MRQDVNGNPAQMAGSYSTRNATSVTSIKTLFQACLMCITFASLSGCGDDVETADIKDTFEPKTSEPGTPTPIITGELLWQSHCQVCHLPLSAGTKADRDSSAIAQSLIDVSVMQNISLTAGEIDLIANALSSTPPEENKKPTVSFATQSDQYTFETGYDFRISVNANDPDGTIKEVRLWIDNTLVRRDSSAPYRWNASTEDALDESKTGRFLLRAVAEDDKGARSAVTIPLEITPPTGGPTPPTPPQNQRPAVSFATQNSEYSFEFGSDFEFLVNASDPDGTIKEVRLWVDSQLVRTERVAPYSWGSSTDAILSVYAPGTYTLRAEAEDNEGLTAQTTTPLVITPAINSSDNIQDIMAMTELNCTNSACHDATPGSVKINLLTGNDEALAQRMVGVISSSTRCAGELLIDPENPDNSLLLKLIDSTSGTQCMAKMPLGSDGIPAQYMPVFQRWVDDLIAAIDTTPPVEPVDPVEPPAASETQAPLVLGMKLKYMLHGGALTNQELAQLENRQGDLDATGLNSLIDTWMETPQFETKLSNFLEITLQQRTNGRYVQQLSAGVQRFSGLINNLKESMVRTALRIVQNDGDFTDIVTTRTWDVTTGVLVAMAYADVSVRPRGSKNFRDAVVLEDSDYSDWRQVRFTQAATTPFNAADFEKADFIASLRALENGATMQLAAPRIGFFNTLTFFDIWQTNTDNQFRLNTNQAMITALGKSFESGDPTEPRHLEGVDDEHAPEGSDCFGCHKNMDPMRNVFSRYYRANNQKVKASTQVQDRADFAFHGHRMQINNMNNFAQAIASHPYFATAWTLKLCQWLNSKECDENDSRITTIAQTFAQSDHNFKTLLKALVTSSLVTSGIEADDGVEATARLSITRRNHFCPAIQERLSSIRQARDFPAGDIRQTVNMCNSRSASVLQAASLIPEDSFTRGGIPILQSNQYDLMLAQGYQTFCNNTARFVVGNSDNHTFKISNANQSINDMVTHVLGIPSNSDAFDDARTSLQRIYSTSRKSPVCANDAALKQAASEDNPPCGLNKNTSISLKAVWVAACQTPYVTSVGL